MATYDERGNLLDFGGAAGAGISQGSFGGAGQYGMENIGNLRAPAQPASPGFFGATSFDAPGAIRSGAEGIADWLAPGRQQNVQRRMSERSAAMSAIDPQALFAGQPGPFVPSASPMQQGPFGGGYELPGIGAAPRPGAGGGPAGVPDGIPPAGVPSIPPPAAPAQGIETGIQGVMRYDVPPEQQGEYGQVVFSNVNRGEYGMGAPAQYGGGMGQGGIAGAAPGGGYYDTSQGLSMAENEALAQYRQKEEEKRQRVRDAEQAPWVASQWERELERDKASAGAPDHWDRRHMTDKEYSTAMGAHQAGIDAVEARFARQDEARADYNRGIAELRQKGETDRGLLEQRGIAAGMDYDLGIAGIEAERGAARDRFWREQYAANQGLARDKALAKYKSGLGGGKLGFTDKEYMKARADILSDTLMTDDQRTAALAGLDKAYPGAAKRTKAREAPKPTVNAYVEHMMKTAGMTRAEALKKARPLQEAGRLE